MLYYASIGKRTAKKCRMHPRTGLIGISLTLAADSMSAPAISAASNTKPADSHSTNLDLSPSSASYPRASACMISFAMPSAVTLVMPEAAAVAGSTTPRTPAMVSNSRSPSLGTPLRSSTSSCTKMANVSPRCSFYSAPLIASPAPVAAPAPS